MLLLRRPKSTPSGGISSLRRAKSARGCALGNEKLAEVVVDVDDEDDGKDEAANSCAPPPTAVVLSILDVPLSVIVFTFVNVPRLGAVLPWTFRGS